MCEINELCVNHMLVVYAIERMYLALLNKFLVWYFSILFLFIKSCLFAYYLRREKFGLTCRCVDC